MRNATQGEKKLNDAPRMVRRIINHHFKEREKNMQVSEIAGGLTNSVFAVEHSRGSFIVRLNPHHAKLCSFFKEQWVTQKVREVGIPAPEVLEVATEAVPVPYMISRQAKGSEATFSPNRLRILRKLGEYASKIHSIRTVGFGEYFDWSHNQLSRNVTWRAFLDHELRLEERIQTLARTKMMDARRLKKLRATLDGACQRGRHTVLNHGDLRLKNVLVDGEGKITSILDWEFSVSNLAPEWDLSITLHDLSIDDKQEFLSGYGLNRRQLERCNPLLKALNIINYAPSVAIAEKAKDEDRLEEFRMRLSGLLNLFGQ